MGYPCKSQTGTNLVGFVYKFYRPIADIGSLRILLPLWSTQSGSVNFGKCNASDDGSGQCITGDNGLINALLVMMVLVNVLMVVMVLVSTLLVMMVLVNALLG